MVGISRHLSGTTIASVSFKIQPFIARRVTETRLESAAEVGWAAKSAHVGDVDDVEVMKLRVMQPFLGLFQASFPQIFAKCDAAVLE